MVDLNKTNKCLKMYSCYCYMTLLHSCIYCPEGWFTLHSNYSINTTRWLLLSLTAAIMRSTTADRWGHLSIHLYSACATVCSFDSCVQTAEERRGEERRGEERRGEERRGEERRGEEKRRIPISRRWFSAFVSCWLSSSGSQSNLHSDCIYCFIAQPHCYWLHVFSYPCKRSKETVDQIHMKRARKEKRAGLKCVVFI